MPQFDPTFFAPQLFWLFLTFVTLYVLMTVVALPKIGAVLDERQRKIDDNLDKAAQLKAEAEAAVAAYERALSESRAHAHSVIKEASDRLAPEAEQIKDGETRIAQAKDKALANVRDVAVDVAGSVFARPVGSAAGAAALKEHGK